MSTLHRILLFHESSDARRVLLAGVLSACVLCGTFAACKRAAPGRVYTGPSAFSQQAQLGQFSKNGVDVSLALERDSLGQSLLSATFSPREPGFHLYGKELPETGIKGIGVPTRLALPSTTALGSAGPVFADATPRDVFNDVLAITLPIYPEGPVTLRLPVEFIDETPGRPTQVALSYMACQTNGSCYPPVRRHLLDITLPD